MSIAFFCPTSVEKTPHFFRTPFILRAFKLGLRWLIFCSSFVFGNMKIVGIVLIVIGIGMLLFRGFSVKTEEKVIDVGPLEVNKTENKWVGWPVYAGGVAIVAGLIMVVADRKK